jgi:lipoprotein-anchoring transpeptidase ErfK/SrfK
MPRIAGTNSCASAAAAALLSLTLVSGVACADPLALAEPMRDSAAWPFDQALRDQPQAGPDEDASAPADVAPALRRQVVSYPTSEPAGTIVIDTAHTYLYLVLGNGSAMRYGIGVGREGFTWSGTETVVRKAEWPDWYPPAEMIQRQPYLPRVMAGGPGNPLGARALYLGNTEYRIHGTNQPSTIGKHVSSGCIRMLNADVIDLFSRVSVGTKVVVLPGAAHPDRPRTVRVRAGGSASMSAPAPEVIMQSGRISRVY